MNVWLYREKKGKIMKIISSHMRKNVKNNTYFYKLNSNQTIFLQVIAYQAVV